MNGNRILAWLSLLSWLVLGACSQAQEAPPLDGAAIGGPFMLTSHEQRPVKDSDFNGRYRLIYFGYSYCPDICPVDLQQIGQGLRAFEKSDPDRAARVQPIFISIDPARDTPNVLKEYVGAFHPRLIGLTGTPDQIKDVAKRYGIYFARVGDPAKKDYLMDHMRTAMLFGPAGEPIAIVPHDQGAAAVAAELGRWVR